MEQKDVLHLDCRIEVTKDDINKEELFKVLKYLRPGWNTTDLICTILSGGYANLTLRCYQKPNPDDSVVFRIWNKNSLDLMEGLVNRKLEIALIHKLGEKGVAPKLFASFTNGVCYEFFDGEKLTIPLCKTDELAKPIAKNFAKVHGMRVDEFSEELQSFNIINSAYECYPFSHPDPETSKILQDILPSKEYLANEIQFLKEYLKELNSPLVQCHGDPHAQNMMYNQKTGKLIFLDYEIANTGYQATDLAAYFLLLASDFEDFNNVFQREFPSEEYQKKFLKWYLEEWFEITGRNIKDLTDKDVNRLYVQVNKYMLYTYFYYAMLFIRFNEIANKDGFHEQLQATDWTRLGLKTLQIYYEKKEFFKSMKVPE